jgi:seryl-tRNA synthetase
MTTLEFIFSSFSALSLIISAYVLLKRSRSQNSVDGSAALLNYDKAVLSLQTQIEEQEKHYKEKQKEFLERDTARDNEVKELRARMIVMQRRIEEQDRTFAEREARLTNWAERLSHQVYSLGGIPVPIEIHPASTDD